MNNHGWDRFAASLRRPATVVKGFIVGGAWALLTKQGVDTWLVYSLGATLLFAFYDGKGKS